MSNFLSEVTGNHHALLHRVSMPGASFPTFMYPDAVSGSHPTPFTAIPPKYHRKTRVAGRLWRIIRSAHLQGAGHRTRRPSTWTRPAIQQRLEQLGLANILDPNADPDGDVEPGTCVKANASVQKREGLYENLGFAAERTGINL